MPKVLDEQALRREDFAEGVEVKLWDGQIWTLPRPVLSGFYPKRKHDGTFEASTGFQFGPEYDRLLDAFIDSTDGLERMGLLFSLAAYLLGRNYDVADADLPRLLYRVVADDPRQEENFEMWQILSDIALGNAPKPTPVG